METTESHRHAGPLTQVLWAAGVGLLVVVAAGGLAASYSHPEVVAIPELHEILDSVAVPYRAVVTAFALPVLTALALAALVGMTRRTDPMALLFSLALLGMFTYTAGLPMALRETFPAASIPALIAEIVALESLAFVIYSYPWGTSFRAGLASSCSRALSWWLPIRPSPRRCAWWPLNPSPWLPTSSS